MGMTGSGGPPAGSAATSAAANATAGGTAGTAASAAQNANTPTWMQGLLGAMTGNTAYGKSAPATHQLLAAGMQMMQPGGAQGMPQAPHSVARPNMPAGGAMPYPGAQGMTPPGASPMGAQMPGGPPQGAAGQQQPGQQNPWLAGLQRPPGS
jgi:hypothetical protein